MPLLMQMLLAAASPGHCCPLVIASLEEGIRISEWLIKVWGAAFVFLKLFQLYLNFRVPPPFENIVSVVDLFFFRLLHTFTKWFLRVLQPGGPFLHGPRVVSPSSAGLISRRAKNVTIQLVFSKQGASPPGHEVTFPERANTCAV